MGAPATLPADFFDKQPPDTLPADFFDKQAGTAAPKASQPPAQPEQKGLVQQFGDWAHGEAEKRATAEQQEAARTGEAHPIRTFLGQLAPNILSDVAGGVKALGSPTNLALGAASLYPPARAAISPYIAGTSAIGALESKPNVSYAGMTERPETLGFQANPEETQKLLLNAAGVAGGAAGMKEAAPVYRKLAAPIAERAAQSLVGPEPANINPVSRPAPALVKEGLVAATPKGMIGKIGDRISEYNQTVKDTLRQSAPAAPEPVGPIITRATQPLIDEARAGLDEKSAVAIEKWRNAAINSLPAQLPLDDLYGRKQVIAKVGKTYAGGPTEEPSVKAARQAVVTEINSTIGGRIPGLRDITQRESGLIQAQDQLENRYRLKQGGPLIPGLRTFLGRGGGESGGGVSLRPTLPGETLLKSGIAKAFGTREPLAAPQIPPSAPLAPTGPVGPAAPAGTNPPPSIRGPLLNAPTSTATPLPGITEPLRPPTSINASGESVASQEAINRAGSEKKGGITRVRVNTRSGKETPLIGVDAVDAKANRGEVIVKRYPDGREEIQDTGTGANYKPRKK